MSDPKDMRPRDAWDVVEDALFEEELEAIAELTPEQIREQLAALGADPEGGRRIAEEVIAKKAGGAVEASAPGPAPAAKVAASSTGGGPAPVSKVISMDEARERRRRRVGLWAFAAAAAITFAVTQQKRIGVQIDAWFHPAPAPTELPPQKPPEKVEPTPQERAAALRQDAYASVDMGYKGEALDELDEAHALDPDGGITDAIRDLRARAQEPRRKKLQFDAKTQVAPWEKPLEKRVVH